MAEKNGFCSAALMLMMGLAVIMASFFILLSENEWSTAKNFYEGIAADNLAQAGICDVLVKLSKKALIDEEKGKFVKREKDGLILTSDARIKAGTYKVYLSYRDETPIVLSIGEYHGVKRQALAVVTVTADGRAVLKRQAR